MGRYARQALTALGVWDVAQPKLAPAESARAALALVERGEVPAAIVYETDALIEHKVKIVGLFPEGTHAPIALGRQFGQFDLQAALLIKEFLWPVTTQPVSQQLQMPGMGGWIGYRYLV